MVVAMKKEYDFSKGKKNPYIADLKKQVTIRLDAETISYFKHLSGDSIEAAAKEMGIPANTLHSRLHRLKKRIQEACGEDPGPLR